MMTLALFLRRYLMVGIERLIRKSAATAPPFMKTLKSTRNKTRLFLTLTPCMVLSRIQTVYQKSPTNETLCWIRREKTAILGPLWTPLEIRHLAGTCLFIIKFLTGWTSN